MITNSFNWFFDSFFFFFFSLRRQQQQRQSNEPLHNRIFSIIKRAYYGDLYARMTESRELLMVMYDFIRLFRCGKITYNDINTILQDVKNTSVPPDNSTEYSEQQKKIKMLERLKFHMLQQMSQTQDVQVSFVRFCISIRFLFC